MATCDSRLLPQSLCTVSSRFISSYRFRLCPKLAARLVFRIQWIRMSDGYPFSQDATFSLLRVHLQTHTA